MYLVIARDQYGAPRAWGQAETPDLARAECERQAADYMAERPDVALTIGTVAMNVEDITACVDDY